MGTYKVEWTVVLELEAIVTADTPQDAERDVFDGTPNYAGRQMPTNKGFHGLRLPTIVAQQIEDDSIRVRRYTPTQEAATGA